jgi:hypothetical protein
MAVLSSSDIFVRNPSLIVEYLADKCGEVVPIRAAASQRNLDALSPAPYVFAAKEPTP